MINIGKKVVVFVLFFALSSSTNLLAATVYGTDPYAGAPSAETMFMDGVFVRPMGLLATLVGGATFILTLPLSALGGNVDEAAQMLVVNPARTTFLRPLGEFN